MLFYSDYNSPRLNYILDLISNEIFNEPFILISDKDAFISLFRTQTELFFRKIVRAMNFLLIITDFFLKLESVNSKSTGIDYFG